MSINGIPAGPPEYPAFRFGEEHQLTIRLPNNPKTQNIVVMVPARKATRPRLPFVEPKSVSYRMLTKQVGIVKIAYFSGMSLDCVLFGSCIVSLCSSPKRNAGYSGGAAGIPFTLISR